MAERAPESVKSDRLDDWFRSIGTQLSNEDYEEGIAAIWQDRGAVWSAAADKLYRWNSVSLAEDLHEANPYIQKEN
jgi:hypothetical protein